ncbi:MAG: hypothetical protein EPN91_02280 [Salinibacterium sp.]|nr:MAG: hypothetical protein EPN91_02280 [Salinibacterium sp.]
MNETLTGLARPWGKRRALARQLSGPPHNLTQEQIAEQLGVTRQRVGQLLKVKQQRAGRPRTLRTQHNQVCGKKMSPKVVAAVRRFSGEKEISHLAALEYLASVGAASVYPEAGT